MLGEPEVDMTNDTEAFESPGDHPLGQFPAVNGDESVTYRAEAIRAFLEKELGLEQMLALQRDLTDENEEPHDLSYHTLDPRMVILAQQLIILDERIAQS
jgi:hypothetical protein